MIDDLDKSSAFWPRTAHEKSLFLITGHCNGRIRVWDVVTGNLLLQLLDHKDIVSCLDVVQTGKGFLASASFDGTVGLMMFIDMFGVHFISLVLIGQNLGHDRRGQFVSNYHNGRQSRVLVHLVSRWQEFSLRWNGQECNYKLGSDDSSLYQVVISDSL